MDGWPRIPNANSGKSSPSRTSTSLPAPGSTVVANVEEDLGDGIYSLRWAGQRINVSSRTPLQRGQALLLKSELSPEGKPRLVVQGPAPQQPQITGRVIYGPGQPRQQQATQQNADQQTTARQNAPQQQPQTQTPSARPQGMIVNTNSEAGSGAVRPPPAQTSGQMAAGIAKANVVAAPEQVGSMVGLILEPLPDLQVAARMLLNETAKEKAALQNKESEKSEEKAQSEEDDGQEAADGEENAIQPEKKARPAADQSAAVRPASPAQSGQQSGNVQGGQPPRAAAGGGQNNASGGSAPSRPDSAGEAAAAGSESKPAQPLTGGSAPLSNPSGGKTPTLTEGGPVVPEAVVKPDGQAAGERQAQTGQGQSGAERPAEPPSVRPAVQPPEQNASGTAAPQNQASREAGQTMPAAPEAGRARPEQPVSSQGSGQAAAPANTSSSSTQAPSADHAARPLPEQGGTPQTSSDAPSSDNVSQDGRQPQPSPSGPHEAQASASPSPAPAVTASEASRPNPAAPNPQPSTIPSAGVDLADETAGPVIPEQPQGSPGRDAAATPAASGSGREALPAPPSGGPVVPPPQNSSDHTAPVAPEWADQSVPAATRLEAGKGDTPAVTPGGSEGSSQTPTAEIKPEILFKEALSQMVKAAEFPMGAPSADAESLGVSNKMPEAVLDKAAAILLRGAGLTPDPATMEAAKALVADNVQVDRDAIQTLLAVTAGVEDAAQRDAMLKAAARLSAKDIPLSPALVSGLADMLGRKGSVQELMTNAMQALTPDPELPEAAPLMEGAKELLDLLHVDLERSDAAVALERYVSTFGREALGKALALVETSAQALLENNPVLQKIDQALTLLLTQLQDDMEAYAGVGGGGKLPSVGVGPVEAETAETPVSTPASQQPQTPVFMRPGAPINAYLNAPRALPIEEMLKNLPPMPKVVSLGTPPPAIAPGQTANSGGQQSVSPPPAEPQSGMSLPEAEGEAADPSRLAGKPEQQKSLEERTAAGVLMKLDRLFQTPGLNRPELELLRPGGLLDRYLDSAANGPDGGKVKADAARLLRELTADNPVDVAKAQQELPKKETAVLRELASRLTKMEAEVVRNDPVMNKLADAATSLRDLGRQLLAAKAENLAGQDRNPGVMLAEVPFKLNDDAGDGRMQMFYRRGKGKGDGWTSRVILDLNTTRMGAVLGDMRFFGQDMVLNLFVEEQRTAEYLAASAEDLTEALSAKGFRLKSKFMVLPPPPAPPVIEAERPRIAGEPEADAAPQTPGTGRRGRLDIKM